MKDRMSFQGQSVRDHSEKSFVQEAPKHENTFRAEIARGSCDVTVLPVGTLPMGFNRDDGKALLRINRFVSKARSE